MNKSKEEAERRRALDENVKNFEISLKAYEYFFKDCLDCAKITKPLLDECDKIYKKLGPKGKGYVEFDKSKIENGTDEDYQKYLLKISNKYNFKTKKSVKIEIEYIKSKPKLSFESLDFSNEKDTNNLTIPYKSRAQKVYKGYRDFAEKVSETVRCELETFEFTLMDPTKYKELFYKIDQATQTIQCKADQLNAIKYICEEIEKGKNSVLRKMKEFNIRLKELQRYCSTKYLLFATRTNNDQFNTATKTLISGTDTLINHLSTLRLNLSNGKYDESLQTCELLSGDVKNIKTRFESYKKLKELINFSKVTSTGKNSDKDTSGKAETIRLIMESCDKEIEKLTTSINERKKSIKKAQKDSIIKILGSITPMLGNALSAINTIAGLFGVS